MFCIMHYSYIPVVKYFSIRCHCISLGEFGVRNFGSVEVFQAVKILLLCSLKYMSLQDKAGFPGSSFPEQTVIAHHCSQ